MAIIRGSPSIGISGSSDGQQHRSQSDDSSSGNDGGSRSGSSSMWTFRRTLSSTFSLSSPSSSSSLMSSSPSSPRNILGRSSLRKSLRRLDSSHRLSMTCSGSDLSQLYLSSPEQDALQILSPSPNDSSNGINNNRGGGRPTLRRNSSWLQAADLYGRRRSFRRMNSYAKFLDMDVMSEIAELDNEANEERMLLIEETDGTTIDDYRLHKGTLFQKCCHHFKSPAILLPIMMFVDLLLGISLSIYDSNLLRNVPGFEFPLVYAFVQKLTNALASLVLICLSRKWELEERRKLYARKLASGSTANDGIAMSDEGLTAELPSLQTFRHHLTPLTAVALVQTISSAFANQALQIIPLPLFKVCLMCGPIFVAVLTSVLEGQYQLYSKGRMFALSLIGVGACRAVYAEAGGSDNPRYVFEGAGYALGASAFSGIGLVLSSVLMHNNNDGNNDQDEEQDDEYTSNSERQQQQQGAGPYGPDSGSSPRSTDPSHGESKKENATTKKNVDASVAVELNPLSLLFYLSCEQVLMLSAYLCPWDILFETQNEEESVVAVEMEEAEAGEFTAFAIYFLQNPLNTISYLMMGSTMSLCLAVLTFVLVNRTSPVATSLLGNVRSIATVAVSSIVFGNTNNGGGLLFGSAAFGYLLTLAGGVAYAMAALST